MADKKKARSGELNEVFQILESMQKQHAELKQRLEDLYQKSGINRKELSNFCANPNNFTPSQWARMQQRNEDLELSITGLSRKDLRKSKEAKDQQLTAKSRRGKTLGPRKKWLDMR